MVAVVEAVVVESTSVMPTAAAAAEIPDTTSHTVVDTAPQELPTPVAVVVVAVASTALVKSVALAALELLSFLTGIPPARPAPRLRLLSARPTLLLSRALVTAHGRCQSVFHLFTHSSSAAVARVETPATASVVEVAPVVK